MYQNFSKRQLLAMTWWNRPRLGELEGIICDGAIRSGKTISMVTGFFLWSMANFNGCTFGLCGRTIGALQRNIVGNLPAWLGDTLQIAEKRSENKLVVRRDGKQNTYYLFGGQDDSAYKLIQGITLAGVLLDEAALMPRSFVEQACARCSEPGSKLWLSCNPGHPEHWLHREWLLKAREKNTLHLHFTMEDNPALDPMVRRRYESLYTGAFYRRYVLGQWCGGEGLVYEFDPAVHVVKTLPTRGRWFISVDYGTQNPFSAGLWCVTGGKAYRVREFYYSGRQAGRMRTDRQYHEDLVKLAGDAPVETVIVDPSASSFIAELRRQGVFRVRKANNAVLPGIQLVTRLLRQRRLLVGDSCRDAIREFGLYRWAEGTDAPEKTDDHTMDEIRYFAMAARRLLDD